MLKAGIVAHVSIAQNLDLAAVTLLTALSITALRLVLPADESETYMGASGSADDF